MGKILVENGQFPDFSFLNDQDIINEKEFILQKTGKSLKELKSAEKQDGFKNFIKLDTIFFDISSLLSPLYLMSSTHTDEKIRNCCDDIVSELSKLQQNILLNQDLYNVLKKSANSINKNLSKSDQKLVDEILKSYERNGFHLPEKERKRLKILQHNLSDLSIEFHKNIAEADDFIIINKDECQGLPKDFLDSHETEKQNYKITLAYPDYIPFMKYSESEEKRKELYLKFLNKAKDKNIHVLSSILEKRQEIAELLSYNSYAEYILEERMAKSPEQVWNFENDLRHKVKEKADSDFKELLNHFNIKQIKSWEKTYYHTKFLKEKYHIDAEEIKEYFSLDNVLNGIFEVSKILFNIEIVLNNSDTAWMNEVRVYDVQEKGKKIARFYLDLHPRPNKYGHAACFDVLSGKILTDGTYRLPAAALVCNFPNPLPDKPSLLYHDDVVTLFHEFGHLLHQILTKAEYFTSSGTSVARDFVETPSQMFENWAWNYESLSRFAKHYQTGKTIDKELFDKIIQAKNVGSGLDTEQQIFYGLIDMTLHDKYKDNRKKEISDLIQELQNKITHFPYVENTHFEASFGHLDGYAAGYYGYLWSKVYAEDFFSLFESQGLFNKELGKHYKEKILEMGGSVDENELVKNFLGREANETAFLKSIGLKVL